MEKNIMKKHQLSLAIASFGLTLIFNPLTASAAPQVFEASGATPADIQTQVDAFRASLGNNNAFGAVFTDVNSEDSTTIEYFDVGGNLLLSQNVLPGSTARGSLSFLGVKFDRANVFLVRITSGNRILKTPARDVVVMDDFIYGEPQASR